MDDVVDKEEILRLTAPKFGTELRLRRYENIYRWFKEGKSLQEIANHHGLSSCTVRQILGRAAKLKEKEPGFVWPTDERGRRLCCIAHPMPYSHDPVMYCHEKAVRFSTRKALERFGKEPSGAEYGYCPICRKHGRIGLPKAVLEAK